MDKKVVLVVDDTPENITLICALLADSCTTKVATNGARALKIAASDPVPDLVLLDVMMPDMDGHEVCRQLKADERTRGIPVIFLTALSDVQDEEKGLALGAVDYVTKPITPSILQARVRTHLQLKDATDRLKDQNLALEQRVRERTAELVKTNESLARFIPDEFLRALGHHNILDVKLGDHVQGTMTVLSIDLRAYTTLAETMTPKEIFDFTNGFFWRMGPVVRQHRGFVAQFSGDGFMAVFPEAAADAVGAAVRMQEVLAAYNAERARKSRQPLGMGIGLNTGPLMLGVVGEETRAYPAHVSDTVNTAARMEGLTRFYGVSIIASESTFDALAERERWMLRAVDRVRPMGKSAPTTIREVFNADPADLRERKSRALALFEKGREHYAARSFAEALKCFAGVLVDLPDDLATKHHLERSAKFLLQGVPADWDGVHVMGTK